MATRLILLCAGTTAANRTGAFPSRDDPLDAGGLQKAQARGFATTSPAMTWTSPDRAAVETATALDLHGYPEPALTDIDHGEWSGCALVDLQARDPAALARWLAEPERGAPGGETMAQLMDRIGPWLDAQIEENSAVLAITHAAVIRASLAYTLAIPFQSAARIDIAPLAVVILSFNRMWRLQELRML